MAGGTRLRADRLWSIRIGLCTVRPPERGIGSHTVVSGMQDRQRRIGIVGYGNAGRFLAEAILSWDDVRATLELAFVWNRSAARLQENETRVPRQYWLTGDDVGRAIRAWLTSNSDVDLIVEMSHASVVREHGLVGSPAAFACSKTERSLRELAQTDPKGHGCYIPSGAAWGIADIARMNQVGAVEALTVSMAFHPKSLRDVAESLRAKLNTYVAADDDEDCVLYEGPVRQLCELAPNNVNTMASLSLAASRLGFDGVIGRLVAGKRRGAHVVEITLSGRDGFEVSTRRALTPKTKLLLFSSPCNPTGAVYAPDELAAIADAIAPCARAFIIADEIYEYIDFSGRHASIGAIDSVRERTITINGFSKGFAMTGWRLGYLAGPAWVAAACAKIQGHFTSGECTFNQAAAVRALLGDLQPTQEMRETFRRRRDLAVRRLPHIPGFKVSVPQGAFYMFPDVSAHYGKRSRHRQIGNADDFCQFLLEEAHVATVSGVAFGDPRCFRLSIAAADSDIDRAIARISEAASTLA